MIEMFEIQNAGVCTREELAEAVSKWNKELLDNLVAMDSYEPKVACF